jgi:hypothetical protein
MWVLGMGAYAVAVMQRTSLGVASFQATERFSAGASLVSLFVGPTIRGPDESWWHGRLPDYLDLVGTPELGIGSVEVRCEDAAAVVVAERILVQELCRRNATLTFEVRTRRR